MFGPDTLVNLSLWTSQKPLFDYVYQSAHLDFMRRKQEWFSSSTGHMVLWWVPVGHIPDLPEALEKLTLLRSSGPTTGAFTFKSAFPPPAG